MVHTTQKTLLCLITLFCHKTNLSSDKDSRLRTLILLPVTHSRFSLPHNAHGHHLKYWWIFHITIQHHMKGYHTFSHQVLSNNSTVLIKWFGWTLNRADPEFQLKMRTVLYLSSGLSTRNSYCVLTDVWIVVRLSGWLKDFGTRL